MQPDFHKPEKKTINLWIPLSSPFYKNKKGAALLCTHKNLSVYRFLVLLYNHNEKRHAH